MGPIWAHMGPNPDRTGMETYTDLYENQQHILRCTKILDGAQSGLGPSPGWGPYGPIWALMGPYGPLWALMGPYGPIWGPYGSSWTGPDMTKSGLLVQFGTFRVQKWYFDEMT